MQFALGYFEFQVIHCTFADLRRSVMYKQKHFELEMCYFKVKVVQTEALLSKHKRVSTLWGFPPV